MSDKGIFRKEEMRNSSPEELGDYIRIATPGVWILLSCILVLAIGAFVFFEMGGMDLL